jgi:hypothetical protein
MSTGKSELIRIAIDNGGTAADADGNRVIAVGRILALIKANLADELTKESRNNMGCSETDAAEDNGSEAMGDKARRKYGHGQLASIHWDRYRVSMTQAMYAKVGAPKDPWGDEMLPIDPAYFGVSEDKALENSYIGDQEPVKEVVEKGPPKRRGRKPAFKAPAAIENADQTDLEASIAALTAELARRKTDGEALAA